MVITETAWADVTALPPLRTASVSGSRQPPQPSSFPAGKQGRGQQTTPTFSPISPTGLAHIGRPAARRWGHAGPRPSAQLKLRVSKRKKDRVAVKRAGCLCTALIRPFAVSPEKAELTGRHGTGHGEAFAISHEFWFHGNHTTGQVGPTMSSSSPVPLASMTSLHQQLCKKEILCTERPLCLGHWFFLTLSVCIFLLCGWNVMYT